MKKRFAISQRDADRFWSKVFVRGKDECWEWLDKIDKHGRPRFAMQGHTIMAHRVSFFLEYEWMPESAIIRTCKNSTCVNPNHFDVKEKKDDK